MVFLRFLRWPKSKANKRLMRLVHWTNFRTNPVALRQHGQRTMKNCVELPARRVEVGVCPSLSKGCVITGITRKASFFSGLNAGSALEPFLHGRASTRLTIARHTPPKRNQEVLASRTYS